MTGRHAGLIVPLFSAASSASWGIGEFPDVAPLSAWLAEGGFDRLMLLPVNAVPSADTSPYSAASAMALDPVYVAWPQVPDFERAGGDRALPFDASDALEAARRAVTVSYADVRAAKRAASRLACEAFVEHEWRPGTSRADDLRRFIEREAWWLDDFALFRAIGESHDGSPWWEWSDEFARREPAALEAARARLADEMLQQQYVQWQADLQWRDARQAAHRHGVAILGDLPFTVGADSADVWARRDIFRLDLSVGAPPDAFSETGQNWHVPCFDWPALAASGYDWLRLRVRRMAALFDGLRVDHLVGLYRTYCWPQDGPPFFSPADEAAQARQGDAILSIFLESSLELVAEDLGTVPDFVRASMTRLGVPGSKVLRWERGRHEPRRPFVDPATFPAASAAMTGTHDTEPLATWWETMPPADRWAAAALPMLVEAGVTASDSWSDRLRDLFLEMTYGAGSHLILVPVTDAFGWRVRINTPATTGDHNWTWRLPWPVDRLREQPEARERASYCRARALASGRAAPAAAASNDGW